MKREGGGEERRGREGEERKEQLTFQINSD